jgi:eukaryotic-like serine/threonine-protein kinase
MSAPETERVLAGRYRLRAVIGRGGMGAVWRARDELLNRDVAVKEIIWPPEMDEAERETARRRAVREAQMVARLRHPNVVGVYDFFEEDGRPAIVMELVPFPSLRDIVRDEGPVPSARAARIGLGVLAGLRAVHRAGVVHRDVKPANILLGPDDRIVLTDFGIAKAVDSPTLTTSGILIGSPSYLAPERARGERADAAADLWGLGASLYSAVEGKPPFERPGVLASLTAVVSEEPEPPLHAGPLRPVINGLLRKDRGTRLGAADAERMLQDVLEQDSGAVRTASMTGRYVGPVLGFGPEAAFEPTPSEPEAATESLPPVAAAPAPVVMVPPEPAAAGILDAAGPPDTRAAPAPHGPLPVRRRGPRRVRGLWAAALIAVLGIAAITAAVTSAVSRTSDHPAAHQPPKGPASSSVHASAPGSTPASASSTPPSATPAPASSPAAAGGAASAAPSGYYRFTNSTGFSIGVPVGWQIQHVGHYVYIRDPANGGIFLLIDQSDQPKPNALADWQQQAAARQSSYPGYHLIRLATVSYPQAEQAADWEFTYDRGGVEVEVLNRNVLANAQHAYALYWSTPVSDWNAYYHYFQVFAATFQPAP